MTEKEIKKAKITVEFKTAEERKNLVSGETINKHLSNIDRFMRDTQISPQEGNQLEQKEDGLYAEGYDDTEIREKLNPIIRINTDYNPAHTNRWYKFAETTVPFGKPTASLNFLLMDTSAIKDAHSGSHDFYGIANVDIRSGDSGLYDNIIFQWGYASQTINCDDFVLAYKVNDTNISVSLWVNLIGSYEDITFIVLQANMGRSGCDFTSWTYINSVAYTPIPWVAEISSEYTKIFSIPMVLQNPIARYEEAISALKSQVSVLETQFKQHSWQEVQRIVRAGLAKDVFPLGYEFTTPDSDTGIDIVWRVVAHDHHKAANENLKHTMTLEMKNVYSGSNGSYIGVQFDAVEALYSFSAVVQPGIYHFTVANQAWYAADNGKSFQFTLTGSGPPGILVIANASYDASLEGKTIAYYTGGSSVTPWETAILTEGNGGTYLGTTDGTGGMNHFHRAVLGSNNYAQSTIRQWLNSAEKAGSVWKQKTKFDRRPTWANTLNGFMHGLPAEFLEVVQPAAIPCRTNSIFEINSSDGTAFSTDQVYNLEDKFFLPSRPEIYGNWDSTSYKDGELLAYYNGFTDTERIKRDEGGSARYSWLRSPDSAYACGVRDVNASGALGSYAVYVAYAVAAACIIA